MHIALYIRICRGYISCIIIAAASAERVTGTIKSEERETRKEKDWHRLQKRSLFSAIDPAHGVCRQQGVGHHVGGDLKGQVVDG